MGGVRGGTAALSLALTFLSLAEFLVSDELGQQDPRAGFFHFIRRRRFFSNPLVRFVASRDESMKGNKVCSIRSVCYVRRHVASCSNQYLMSSNSFISDQIMCIATTASHVSTVNGNQLIE